MTDLEQTQLSMMTVSLGQDIAYQNMDSAKRTQRLMMDWIKASPYERQSIYKNFRNDGCNGGLEAQ